MDKKRDNEYYQPIDKLDTSNPPTDNDVLFSDDIHDSEFLRNCYSDYLKQSIGKSLDYTSWLEDKIDQLRIIVKSLKVLSVKNVCNNEECKCGCNG